MSESVAEGDCSRSRLAESRMRSSLRSASALLVSVFFVLDIGLGPLTAMAILVLATAVASWLAALIVAVVYLLIAGGLALAGRSKVQAGSPPVPAQTVVSVKEDVREAKEKAKEGRA